MYQVYNKNICCVYSSCNCETNFDFKPLKTLQFMYTDLLFHITYPILFTYTSSILEVPRPSQAQSSHFKVPVCKHIS